MKPSQGIQIESVAQGSPASEAGLLTGDIIDSVSGHPVRDQIDFMYYKGADAVDLDVKRGSVKHSIHIDTNGQEDLGITLKSFKVKGCRNNCIFCFVKQLPKGLRKTLYLKDDDYRLSFLYGNYLTLSNLDDNERKRIIEQRLSPLYVSVHSTNPETRNKMLNNPGAAPILKDIKFFCERKIRIHSQIVLCPGYNDGKDLKQTISDLCRFYPYLASIAVVPVGLTSYRNPKAKAVEKEDALKAIELVDRFQKLLKKRHGDPVVYCADEMYLKAGLAIPKYTEYGAFPQIENGVGMIALFLNSARKVRLTKPVTGKKLMTFTGMSFYPYLQKFISRLKEHKNINIEVLPVENSFFGPSVTVAGLLSGRDVIRTVRDGSDSHNYLIVPETVLKDDDDIFIDDVSLMDIEKATGIPVLKTNGTPEGLIETITTIS